MKHRFKKVKKNENEIKDNGKQPTNQPHKNKDKPEIRLKDNQKQAHVTNEKKPVKIDYKDLYEKMKTENEKLLKDIDKWRIKYEHFAKQMELRFQAKINEVSENAKKSLNDEKIRVGKELDIQIHSVLSKVFAEIADQVLNTSKVALSLPNTISDETKRYAKGFQMLISNLEKVLQNNGLVINYPKVNDEFNPNIHHAISKEFRDDLQNKEIIIEVLTPQYELRGKTISYAKVRVAVNKDMEV